MTNQLSAKIVARNSVNREVNERMPAVCKALAAFVGQKVVLDTSFSLTAKLRKALPELPNTVKLHGYYSATRYSIRLNMRVCVTSPSGGSTYAEQWVTVGDLNDDASTLKSVLDFNNCGTFHADYRAPEIIAARMAVEAAEKALSNAQSDRCFQEFGRHDN